MTDSATAAVRFLTDLPSPLTVTFDAPALTSDGGLPWLHAADRALDVCATLARHLPDRRAANTRHPLLDLVRQRVFQIACGYEDQNDADILRHDPLLKLVCGRLPVTGPPLASQPTLSRLDNLPSRRDCYRMAVALGEVYLYQRERSGVPRSLLLDFDATDDPAHGEQEGTAYHGYFRQHQYHPLLVFDGDTDQLITAVLRPGNAHAGRGALAVLRRIVRAVRGRWGRVPLALRADAGFALPALYDYCEREGIAYTIGLVTNQRLRDHAAPLLAEAQAASTAQGGEKVRLLGAGAHQAGSWPAPRRVVMKAEVLTKGTNTRFVVTNRDEEPDVVYDGYTDRGECENWIKDFKRGLRADRLSCHRFAANQFRLLLHAAAYWLLDTVRRSLVAAGAEPMRLETVRLRLVKIGGWVRQQATQVSVHLAAAHPGQPLWAILAATWPAI
jgi:hypothetical protein